MESFSKVGLIPTGWPLKYVSFARTGLMVVLLEGEQMTFEVPF